MKTVKAHPFRIQWSLNADFDGDQEYLGKSFQRVAEEPFLLTTLSRYALRKGVFELVTHHDQTTFLNDLRTAHIARTWNWRALVSHGPHRIALPGIPTFECGMVHANASVDLGTWLQGIYIAMILRDIPAVRVYGQADPERIVRYGQNTPDPWEIPYIKFLNGIWAFDTSIGTHLKEALRGTDPSLYRPERADYLLNIISPILELWAMVFTHDPARFNHKLHE